MQQIALLSDGLSTQKTKHFVGLPPELNEGKDSRRELGPASFLVIEEGSGGTFLFRYDTQGSCVGDTWHMNVGDAKHQASYEFGDSLHQWSDVPPDAGDVVIFGLNQLAASR